MAEVSRPSKGHPGTHTKSTLFIHDLPQDANNKDLEDLFSEWGPIRSAFVVTAKKGEEIISKGIGFVHFALAEDAKRALEATSKGAELKGKAIKVELALRKHADKELVLPKKRTAKDNLVEEQKPEKRPKSKGITLKSPCFIVKIELAQGKEVDFDRKQLYKRFRKVGDLTELVYPFEDNNLQAKLIFSSRFEAQNAVSKLEGHIFKGHKFLVSVDPMEGLKNHRLIIRNLPFNATVEVLKNSFNPFGEILEVSLPKKPNNDKLCRGFAFIQFVHKDSAEKALQGLNGKEILGRMVAVDWAVNKSVFEKSQQQQAPDTPEEEDDDEEIDVVGGEEKPCIERSTSDKGPNIKASTPSEDDGEDLDVVNVTDESEGDEEDEESSKQANSLNSTVFIRNVSFATEESDLIDSLSKFGSIEYCKIVRDPASGNPKGTAFAKFKNDKGAMAACEASKTLSQNELEDKYKAEDMNNLSTLEKSIASVEDKLKELARKRTGKEYKSVVENFSLEGDQGEKGIIVDGRALLIVPAVDKKQAKELKKESDFLDSGPQDRRNLYLLNESLVKPKTSLSKKFWPAIDISHREGILKERRKELKKNPNLFVSKTRLSLRYLPTSIAEADIKKVLKAAVDRALKVDESSEGYPIIDEKIMSTINGRPFLKQVKVVRASDQKSRSKGYGFAEFSNPLHSLLCVRYLSNYYPNLWKEYLPDHFGSRHHSGENFKSKAPVVEFATEKAAVLEKRKSRIEQAKKPIIN